MISVVNEPYYQERCAKEPRQANTLTNIADPLPTDCLIGVGTNHHHGNKLYHQRVEEKKELYLRSKKSDKKGIAMDIVEEWRGMNPPGRFLKQDVYTRLWNDVGDKKAQEKMPKENLEDEIMTKFSQFEDSKSKVMETLKLFKAA